jgi:hypothetical protein
MILSLSLISLLQYITEVEINVLKNSLLIQLLYNASDIPRNRLYYGLKTFGDYTLSVVYFNKVEHYRVILRHNKLEIDGGDCRFDTLFDLVEVTRHATVVTKNKISVVTRIFA